LIIKASNPKEGKPKKHFLEKDKKIFDYSREAELLKKIANQKNALKQTNALIDNLRKENKALKDENNKLRTNQANI
jgi:hypothetical protein